MNKYGDKILGIALITSALLFLASELNILPNLTFGVVIPGIVFVGLGIAGIYSRNYTQATFSFVTAYVFIYDTFGLPKISYLALLLIAALFSVGISLLLPKKLKKAKVINGKKIYFDETTNDISVTFGEVEKYISTSSLQEINIDILFGEAKVYFESSSMLNKEATVHIDSTFGEVCLFVPRNWRVDTSVKAIFGDVSKAGVIEDQTNTLYVTGKITCTEVQIIYI